jgi:vacuolar iron transporter family protein
MAEPTPERRPLLRSSRSRRQQVHHEHHSNLGNVIRDIIIGFADGLTVPFALTAGLSSYVMDINRC